jgi:hypothetical protein
MQLITDEFMLQMRTKARAYCIVMLKVGPQYTQPDGEQIIWEHGRRNYALRAEGLLAMVGPVTDNSDVRGFGIFIVGVDEARTIMDENPCVKAGVFAYELHPWRSLPGDSLPA